MLALQPGTHMYLALTGWVGLDFAGVLAQSAASADVEHDISLMQIVFRGSTLLPRWRRNESAVLKRKTINTIA